jgi:hypothetical protein
MIQTQREKVEREEMESMGRRNGIGEPVFPILACGLFSCNPRSSWEGANGWDVPGGWVEGGE